MKTCLECEKEFEGRVNKIFCSDYCKSSYHNERNKSKEDDMFRRIDKQLKLNRRILKLYNRGGKTTVRREVLIDEGFNPTYFTHYWKNKSGDVYLFCYEYGFVQREERGIKKYVLVHWQSYMDK